MDVDQENMNGQQFDGRKDGEGSADVDKGKGKQKADEPQYYPVKRVRFGGDMEIDEEDGEIEY